MLLYAMAVVFAIHAPVSTQTMVASGQQQGACAIRGTVVGSDSHGAVPLAPVSLLVQGSTPGEAASSTTRTTTADEQGAFVFGDLQPAIYRVSASPGPYFSQYLPLKPAEGVSVDLTQCQAAVPIEVPLPVGAVITGRVTDGQGTPLVRVHVTVTAVAPNEAHATRPIAVDTDDSGQYRVFGLASGNYVVDASPFRDARDAPGPAGYIRTFYPDTADKMSAQAIHVERGQQAPGVDIQLVQSGVGAIEGRVTDSTGANRVACWVSALRQGAEAVTANQTNAEGRFHIANLLYGTYTISVGCPGAYGKTPEQAEMTVTLADHLATVTITTAPKD